MSMAGSRCWDEDSGMVGGPAVAWGRACHRARASRNHIANTLTILPPWPIH